MDKQTISTRCEEVLRYCLEQVPQVQNDEIIWILNGSTLCNILCNIKRINNKIASEKFHNASLSFVRIPKGDLDICCKKNLHFNINMDNEIIRSFQEICEEKRYDHFVDMNSELEQRDIEQLCLYETNRGLKFFAKAPQYLLLYKFFEFNGKFHDYILSNDFDTIVNKKKNSINDLKSLYLISSAYIGKEETKIFLLNELKDFSNSFHRLYKLNENEYSKIIEIIIQMIETNDNLKIKDY